jgi:type IV pilus assembly protein PilM
LLVAAPLKIINTYINIADFAGMDIVAIETESVALGRAMYRATNQKHVVMLDFGANSTDMSIMLDGYLVFSQSISIGSDSLTQAIVNKFNFEYQQAEEYKRNYGVVPNVLEGKIHEVLSPILESIVVEVRRGIEFYKNKTLAPAPTEFFLTGDGALLPGLSDYLSQSLNANAAIANPWSNIAVDSKFQDIIAKSGPSYSVAIGLALKDE